MQAKVPWYVEVRQEYTSLFKKVKYFVSSVFSRSHQDTHPSWRSNPEYLEQAKKVEKLAFVRKWR